MIPSDTFHKHEAFYIVSKLLENSIAAMELICVKVGSRKLNFIVSICLEKFCRQRQLFYLLCFKAFQKHLWNDYCGVLFSNGWRKYSVTSAEMNFFVQTFSLKRTEGRHSFFIYFDSKLFLRVDYSGALF